MSTLYLLLTMLLLWVSVAGVTLLVQRQLQDFALARTAGLAGGALLLFGVEHIAGLGRLSWLLPVALGFGAWQLWQLQRRGSVAAFARAEAVFVLAFVYGLFWRWSFPDITPSSEKLTDLYFISNYYAGSTLPPLDNWNPPQRFDFYYAFQHYAAALLGRVFGLQIGVAYNLGFALLMSLPLTLAWSLASRCIQQRSLRVLLVVTLALGGTGFSPLLHLGLQAPRAEQQDTATQDAAARASTEPAADAAARARYNIMDSVRFIGETRDRELSGGTPMVLPAENYGYQFFLGDFHPPIGGFVVLLLALAAMAAARDPMQAPRCQALLGLTLPLLLVTNTWLLPLQALLLAGWLLQQHFSGRPLHWLWLLGGAFAGSVLIQPFLQGFADTAAGVTPRWVGAGQHTPPLRFLQLHWPFLLLLALAACDIRQRRVAGSMAALWLLLLLLGEFVYMDDITAAQYERTNTTMKWWGWVHSGIVVMMGALTLGSGLRWVRWAAVAVLLSLNIVAVDLARYWYYSPRNTSGELAGHAWYTQDPVQRQLLEYLAAAPHGVVLESIPARAYTNSSMHALFSGKPVLLGWPSHLQTWQGGIPRQEVLALEIGAFYLGALPDALPWLASHHVDYIVFARGDQNELFNSIDAAIRDEFVWHEFNPARIPHIGVWVRSKQ